MEAVPANCLGEVRSLALQACVIGIDEGQFVSIYCIFSSLPFWFKLVTVHLPEAGLVWTCEACSGHHIVSLNLCFFCVILVSRHSGVL